MHNLIQTANDGRTLWRSWRVGAVLIITCMLAVCCIALPSPAHAAPMALSHADVQQIFSNTIYATRDFFLNAFSYAWDWFKSMIGR